MADKHKALALLLMGKKKPEEAKEDEEESGEAEMAAQDFLDAVTAKDAKGLVKAFQRLDMACSDEGEYSDEE